jgi:hypothetical protein
LKDTVPAIDPCLLGTEWWLFFPLRFTRNVNNEPGDLHPGTFEAIRRCDIPAVRVNFLYRIYDMAGDIPYSERRLQEFELLVQYSGGLCFLKDYFGTLYSPLSAAMRCGQSLLTFRMAMSPLSLDLHEAIRAETELRASSWTDVTLLDLFAEGFTLYMPLTSPSPCKSFRYAIMPLHFS